MMPLLLALLLAPPVLSADKDPFAAWEPEIRKFEQLDKEHEPAPGGVLFMGSSSVKFWDLKKSGLPGVNRGFGGSQIADSTHFFDRLAVPQKPAVIVLFAGTNDLNAGKTPEQVAADFRAFVKLTHEKLPATRIIFIAIQPTIARWAQRDKQVEFNNLAKAVAHSDSAGLVAFLDPADALLAPGGTPHAENYRPDKLHLSDAGYKIVTEALKPLLEDAMRPHTK